MLGSLGLPEIIFILLLALLVFGPKRLPEIGRKLGRALGEFRRATGDLKRTFDQELTMSEVQRPARQTPPEENGGNEAVDSETSASTKDTVPRPSAAE
jgi:TatA/E family protein of Tat protein translocase